MQCKSIIYIFLRFLCSHNDECATATCKLTLLNQSLSCSHLSTGALSVYVSATSTTSLVISWTLTEGVTATSYNISYTNTDTQCFTDSDNFTDIGANETMYTVTGLQEGTEYSISVTAILSDGESGEDSLTASTMATG